MSKLSNIVWILILFSMIFSQIKLSRQVQQNESLINVHGHYDNSSRIGEINAHSVTEENLFTNMINSRDNDHDYLNDQFNCDYGKLALIVNIVLLLISLTSACITTVILYKGQG